MRKETCKCGKIKERRHAGNCNSCHSAYTREWKKTHPYSEEQKKRWAILRTVKEQAKPKREGQRKSRLGAKRGIIRPLCSWCDVVIENFKKKKFCKPCAAKYNREWRKKNPSSPEQKFRDMVRVKTYDKIRSGKLVRQPCEVCGDLKVEGHHDDYNKPYDLRWLCSKHHREHHTLERNSNASNSENNK